MKLLKYQFSKHTSSKPLPTKIVKKDTFGVAVVMEYTTFLPGKHLAGLPFSVFLVDLVTPKAADFWILKIQDLIGHWSAS